MQNPRQNLPSCVKQQNKNRKKAMKKCAVRQSERQTNSYNLPESKKKISKSAEKFLVNVFQLKI